MAYTLRAFVAGPEASAVLAEALGTRPVPLEQGLLLVALPRPAGDDPVVPSSFGDDAWWLTAGAEELAGRAALRGPVAYLEAEYFGGTGEQHAVLWRGGEPRSFSSELPGAINIALGALGARRLPSGHEGRLQDEFDSVGLGRHRHTEDWTPGLDA